MIKIKKSQIVKRKIVQYFENIPVASTFRRKSSNIYVWSLFLNGTREALMPKWTDLRISKAIRVRSQAMTIVYDSPFFLAKRPANVFKNKALSPPIPPFVPNTRGVNVPCSTSTPYVDCRSRFGCVALSLIQRIGFRVQSTHSYTTELSTLRKIEISKFPKHIILVYFTNKKYWLTRQNTHYI